MTGKDVNWYSLRDGRAEHPATRNPGLKFNSSRMKISRKSFDETRPITGKYGRAEHSATNSK